MVCTDSQAMARIPIGFYAQSLLQDSNLPSCFDERHSKKDRVSWIGTTDVEALAAYWPVDPIRLDAEEVKR